MISGPRPSNLVDRIQELDLNKEDRMTRAQRMIGPVAAALLLAVTAVTTQAQPQFAGTWTLDPAQSKFPAREGGHGHKAPDGAQPETPKKPPTVKLLVEQSGVTIKVTRSMARDNRERSYSQSFVADGSERTEGGHRGSTTVTRAPPGGDRLVTTSTTTGTGQGGGDAKAVSCELRWTVSPDARTR